MVETVELTALPPVPRNPLPRLQQLKAIRAFHTGCETLRDAGGPVTRLALSWPLPPVVVTTSPMGARNVLGRSSPYVDRNQPLFDEHRRLVGDSLFNLRHDAWLPRRRAMQPLFSKQNVTRYAGQMAAGADRLSREWGDGAVVDLDRECHRLLLELLAQAVLGLDLGARTEALLGVPLRTAATYITDRAVRPVRAPWWLPTPTRRRARAASATFHKVADDVVRDCRADPTREAPLIRALIDVTDPDTGRPLSDEDIGHELVSFLGAGQDTAATALTYTLWVLGRHPEVQDNVVAEVAALGDRPLTADDVPRLGYTVQVLHEAMRLCPPAAATTRTVTKDIDIDGYRVDAGSWAIVGIYALHRDPALWDRPKVFDPDRFSRANCKDRDRWQYLPFGGGPRSCIADNFAMLALTLGLATIIRHSEIRSLNDDFPLSVPFTMVAGAPIPARVSPRIRRRGTEHA
ncbi:cytochrome P450 [Gordonia sp. NPDC003424]